MKKSTLLAILGMGLLLTSYGCLAYGIFLGEKNEMFVNAFVTLFVLGAIAFLGYLKMLNKEVRQTKRVLFLNR
jgi:hypothetical protein